MHSQKKILVVGETFLDENIYGQAERLSPEAPVPVFNNGKSTFFLGGAANVAKNLANLGVKVSLLTILGDDEKLSIIRNLISSYNINLVDHNYKLKSSMQKIRFIVNQQQLFRHDIEEMVCPEFSKKIAQIVYETCNLYDMIIFSDYNKGLLNSINTKDIRSKFKKKILIDSKSNKKNLISYANILKPNMYELEKICSLYNIKEVGINKKLSKIMEFFHIENILLTRGDQGMTLAKKQINDIKFLNIKPLKRDVYDVTGAGDTVISILGFCLNQGMKIEKAAKKANYVASISITHIGTYTPTLKDLDARDYSKVVFTNGCFDILHVGHVSLLNECKKIGSKVIVGLNSDSSVKRLKGESRPFNNQIVRKKILESLESVDEVIIFEEDTPYNLIKKLNPDIIVKGGDYLKEEIIGTDIIEKYGGEAIIVPFIKNYSTSKLAQKIENDL